MDSPQVCRGIDKRFVHKAREENVLIGDVLRVSMDPEMFECTMVVDPLHPFFFEHPADHVPGMMLAEAGRQMGLAISHLFFNGPFGTHFISREIRVSFTAFAEVREPVVIRSWVKNKCYRHGALSEAVLQGDFLQHGKVVAHMEGDWKMFPGDVYQHFREHRE